MSEHTHTPVEEVLDGKDMQEDLFILLGYTWVEGVANPVDEFDSNHFKELGDFFLEKHSGFNVLKKALQDDPDYAWSWHCNIAVSSQDEGMDHAASNRAAARFMSNCFKVDMTKHEHYPKEA